jgi:hypothetical protein
MASDGGSFDSGWIDRLRKRAGREMFIWQQEGYHALLHHLNAIYGYEALVYWEKRWKSF